MGCRVQGSLAVLAAALFLVACEAGLSSSDEADEGQSDLPQRDLEEPSGAEPTPPQPRDADGGSSGHRSWSDDRREASEPGDADEDADRDEDAKHDEEEAAPDEAPLEGVAIALDPGHNGANADHPEEISRPVDAGGVEKQCNTVGASTPDGVTESEIVFDLSLMLLERLEAQGAKVSMTREDDQGWGPCIDERGQHAAEVGADVLVSVHADGGPPDGHGFHIIHPGEVPGYNDELVEPSTNLATDLRDALKEAGRPPATYVGTDGLHQREDIGTLNHADVPAVLVEVGNLQHAEEAELLTSDAGQEALAEALENGLVRHLDEHEHPDSDD